MYNLWKFANDNVCLAAEHVLGILK